MISLMYEPKRMTNVQSVIYFCGRGFAYKSYLTTCETVRIAGET